MSYTKKIMTNHILKHANKSVLALKDKLELLRQLNQLLAKQIDPEMAKHAQVIKFEKNCLFVLVSSGNWATQLRFRIPELLRRLQQYPILKGLNGIICKTHPVLSQAKPPVQSRQNIKLSAESSQSILEIAKTIQDKKLRAILEKIAGYTK